MDIDYLIIGQGIAGSVLSYQLMKLGCSVMVFGRAGLTTSSEVAAGLYNPVTGRKMVKTWLADELFRRIEPTYREMERLSGGQFLHSIPIYRPFIDIAEQNDWQSKQAEPGYGNFISNIFEKPFRPEVVHNPYGGVLLKQSGWLDIPQMLQAWQSYLKEKERFKEEEFLEHQLIVGEAEVKYAGYRAKKIIFCNGNKISESQYWKWVPLRPVKGEVLLVKASVELEEIVNRGVFLLPLGKGYYKVGSTYDQRDLSLQVTTAARKDMLERLTALVKMPVEVLDQVAGIRPATKDRRPVVGLHPEHKTLVIFNGLGTKGVSLAPYCAEILADGLLEKNDLQPGINIERFFSLYYS